mgnify:CR=1 FL=1
MKIMNFHQSIFQNNNLKIIKYLSLIILIFVLSFKANTEIPEKYKIFSALNSMTSVVEIFKLSFFGSSSIEFIHIFLSILITLMIFLLGLFLFGRMEKNFMDTI